MTLIFLVPFVVTAEASAISLEKDTSNFKAMTRFINVREQNLLNLTLPGWQEGLQTSSSARPSPQGSATVNIDLGYDLGY